MARARNIKPGFYKNDDLAECSIWARFIFPGLWMLADREGRVEDRPKRIKGELLPFDSQEVEPLLVELEDRGFIRRYVFSEKRCIQIVNFAAHQAPHGTEKDSELPDENGFLTVNDRAKGGFITGKVELEPYSKQVINGATPVIAPPADTLNNGTTPVKNSVFNALNPESLFIESGSLIPELIPSEDKSSGASPPKLTDPNEIIFGYGLPMLTNAGTAEKQARSFLGGLRKHHGDQALIDKLRECAKAKPLQPLEWLAAALPPTGSKAKAGMHAGFENQNYHESL